MADILKQQGHFHDLNTLAYSSDGAMIATGGDDGKVRWSLYSRFDEVKSSDCGFWHAGQVVEHHLWILFCDIQ